MRPGAVLVAASALLGCQGPPTTLIDEYGEDCPEVFPEPPGALLPELTEFPTTGCRPDTLDGFDPVGLWYAKAPDGGGGLAAGPFRIAARCGGLFATGDAIVTSRDDGLFWGSEWRWSETNAAGESRLICARDPDGAVSGWAVSAFFWEDNRSVDQGPFVARPFGWAEGEAQADGLELISVWRGTYQAPWPSFLAINVRVHDRIAYLITREGLRIVDVRDPAIPVDLGFHAGNDDEFNDVKLVSAGGRVYALLASNTYGTAIVDVTDPAATVEVDRFDPTGGVSTHTLFTQVRDGATMAYFVDGGTSVLAIYDFTDPRRRRLRGLFEGYPFGISGAFHDLFVAGDRAYVNASYGGFVVVDVGNPVVPTLVGQSAELVDAGYSHSNWVTVAGGRRVAVHGDEGYGSFVRIVDVDEDSPEFLQTIGEFRLREQVSVHNIMAIGERAYVAYYQNGLRVLDLSDPTRPRQIAYYNTWDPEGARGAFYEGALGVDVDDRGLIYVADSEAGLVILREIR